MEDLANYVYSPLQNADDIRLLELLPSGRGDDKTIRCRLFINTLAVARETYSAISYVWGDTDLAIRKPVVCNGAKIVITPTLYSALTRLRYKSCIRLLWVDALCIDQSNDEERGQQVTLMKRIYAEAQSVIVDLGEVSEVDKPLLECFCKVGGISQSDWVVATTKFGYPIIFNPDGSLSAGKRTAWSWIQSNTTRAQSFITRAIFGQPLIPRWEELFNDSRVWTGFKRFLERPWFGRLWIIQEFALAKRISFLVGSSIKSEEFLSHTLIRLRTHVLSLYDDQKNENALEMIPKEELASHTFSRHSNQLQELLKIRHRFSTSVNPYVPFPELFTRTNLASCTDPRDKVYGVLGLVDTEDAADIRIDYGVSAETVAFRITTHFIQHGRGVYALYNASGCDAKGVSWKLNLQHRIKTDQLSQFVQHDVPAEEMPYRASLSTNPVLKWDDTTQRLFTKGYILDTISDLTNALVDSMDPGVAPARLRWQLQTQQWIETRKLNKPFVPPNFPGRRTVQKDRIIRQMAINHANALAIANDAFEVACWTTAIADMIHPTAFAPRRATADPSLRAYIQAFKTYLYEYYVLPLAPNTSEDAFRAHQKRTRTAAAPFLGSLHMAYNRRLGITQARKILCLAPAESQAGDAIAILMGCPIPFVLRPCGPDEWRLVGCCYAHGLMDGEVFGVPGLEARDITIC